MKNPFIKLLLVSCILLSKVWATPMSSSPVILLDNWPPYIVGTVGKEPIGGDLLKFNQYIFQKMGYEDPPLVAIWTDVLSKIFLGTADMTIGFKNDDRAQFADFSVPFATISRYLYFRQADAEKFKNYDGYKSLVGKKIGLIKGFDYGELLYNSLALGLDIAYFDSYRDMQKALSRKRIDTYIYIDDRSQLPAEIAKSDYVVQSRLIHYFISKKSRHSADMEKLNRVIKDTLNDPELQDLLPERLRMASPAR